MSILVTGAAGFIGSHVTEELLRQGEKVVGIDNFDDFYDPGIKRSNLIPSLENPGFELVEGDILDDKILTKVFEENEIETIVHLAARAGVRPSIEQPMVYIRNNVEATTFLLEAMRRHRVDKMVFGSSSSVYGENDKVPFSEDDRVDAQISPYAATKKACETILYAYSRLFDIKSTLLRFFTVYGPRQRPEMAIHKFTRMIDRGEEIPMFGDGASQRDYTYIDDIIQGVIASIEKAGEKPYRIYNLGESDTIELGDLINAISEAVGKPAKIKKLPDQPGDVKITFADITRAREELGYTPTTPVREGVRKFVDWYKNTLSQS